MIYIYALACVTSAAAIVVPGLKPCLGPKYPLCAKPSFTVDGKHIGPQFANYEPGLGHLYTAASSSDVLNQFSPLTGKTFELPLTRATGANVDLVVTGIATNPYHNQVWVSLSATPDMNTNGHAADVVATFKAPLSAETKSVFVAKIPADIEDIPEYPMVKRDIQQLAVDSFGNAYYTFIVKHDWEPNGLFVVKVDAAGKTSTLVSDEWVSPNWAGHVMIDDKLVGFGLNNDDAFFYTTDTMVGSKSVVTKALNFASAVDAATKKRKVQNIMVLPSSDGTFVAVTAKPDVWLFEHDKTTGVFAYLGHTALPQSKDGRKVPGQLVEICPGELHVGYWSKKRPKKEYDAQEFMKLDTYRAPLIHLPCQA